MFPQAGIYAWTPFYCLDKKCGQVTGPRASARAFTPACDRSFQHMNLVSQLADFKSECFQNMFSLFECAPNQQLPELGLLHGQLIPTPRSSTLHQSRPSQLPYNKKGRSDVNIDQIHVQYIRYHLSEKTNMQDAVLFTKAL